MSTLEVTTVKSKTASTPPVINDVNDVEVGQVCRAWVNFNGSGTVTIRDSFNVSSITDNGVGDYTVNLTAAMANVNYCLLLGSNLVASTYNVAMIINSISTTDFRIRHYESSTPALTDASIVTAGVFSNP